MRLPFVYGIDKSLDDHVRILWTIQASSARSSTHVTGGGVGRLALLSQM